MKVKVGGKDCHLMQPSKEPGLKGTPWPMSPNSRSPSVSLSKAASTLGENKAWVQLTQTRVVGRPVISVTARLRQEYPKLGTSLGYITRPYLKQTKIRFSCSTQKGIVTLAQGRAHTYPTWQG